ncbi:MAG: hypothetical protein IIC53_05085 [Proteobacteria bacterium]|nr:hypothetical protein [Pseudomonadota bacterium]
MNAAAPATQAWLIGSLNHVAASRRARFPTSAVFHITEHRNHGGAAAFGVAPSARRYLDEYKIRAKNFSAVTALAGSDKVAAYGPSMRDSACTGRLENKKMLRSLFGPLVMGECGGYI